MRAGDGKETWFDRGLEAAKLLQEPLASATEAFSGRAVQREVAEYTEVFTQVALGMHEDLQAARRQVRALAAIAVLALLAGLAGLGLALWTLLA